MRFARVVFGLAGLIGLVALVPLYQEPGDTTYYGLLAPVAAWQIAFLMIAWKPVQFRLIMIPAALEKIFWVITMLVLFFRGSLSAAELGAAISVH